MDGKFKGFERRPFVMFLSDEEPTLKTSDFTTCIGSTFIIQGQVCKKYSTHHTSKKSSGVHFIYLETALLKFLKMQIVSTCCYDDVLRDILLRKISEFPSGTRTHNLLIAGEML